MKILLPRNLRIYLLIWRAYGFGMLGAKTRKILQQNFDQDAVGDLVWCGNMN